MDFKVTCGTVLYRKSATDAFFRMREFVVIKICRHETLLGERDSNARRVAGDPAPAPLFRNVGGRAGAASRIQDKIAGIGGH